MSKYLLEVGCEELPYKFIPSAIQQLKNGFETFLNNNKVEFENVNVYATGGMGFRVENGKNFYLNRTNFATKKGSNRIMTCTADIIHTICFLQ